MCMAVCAKECFQFVFSFFLFLCVFFVGRNKKYVIRRLPFYFHNKKGKHCLTKQHKEKEKAKKKAKYKKNDKMALETNIEQL